MTDVSTVRMPLYTPSFWDRRDYVWAHSTSTVDTPYVAYNAIPAYHLLRWTAGCATDMRDVQSAKEGGWLWTGVASRNLATNTHRPGCDCDGAYPKLQDESDCAGQQFRWPAGVPKTDPRRGSPNNGGCYEQGMQYLVAKNFESYRGYGACREVGTVGEAAAVYERADAADQRNTGEGIVADGPLRNLNNLGKFVTGDPHFARMGTYSESWPKLQAPHSAKGRVVCRYPANALQTDAHVVALENQVRSGGLPPSIRAPLLAEYCTKEQETTALSPCPTNDVTGKPNKRCVRFATTGTVGKLCRELWWDRLAAEKQDAFMTRHCSQFPENEECACIEADRDPVFTVLQSALPTSRACFWRACQAEGHQTLKTSAVRNYECELSVCQNILHVVQSNNINLDGAAQTVSCSKNSTATGDALQVDEPGVLFAGAGGAATAEDGSASFVDRHPWLVYGGALLCLLACAVFYFLVFANNPPVQTQIQNQPLAPGPPTGPVYNSVPNPNPAI